jgi:phosphomevalonate kinase
MKNNFSKTWDEMTIPQRIEHLLADWKTCKDTQDPMILRVAATVAHHVLKQARDKIEELQLSSEERVANIKSADWELREQIKRLRVDLKLMTEEHRAACEDRDLIQRERDEARRKFCSTFVNPEIEAAARGWDCFKEDGK